MPDIKQALRDFVATSNSGKYSDENVLISKFPELKGYDINALKDFVATSNSGKYKSEDELFSKFPEFGFEEPVKKKEPTPSDSNSFIGPVQPNSPLAKPKVNPWDPQPTAKDKLLAERGLPTTTETSATETPSGTAKPPQSIPAEQNRQVIEKKKEAQVANKNEIAFNDVNKRREEQGLNTTTDLFKQESDSFTQFLIDDDARQEYELLSQIRADEDAIKQFEETKKTNPSAIAPNMVNPQINYYKSKLALEKFYISKEKQIDEEIAGLTKIANDPNTTADNKKKLQDSINKLKEKKANPNYLKNPDEKVAEIYSQVKGDMELFKIPGATPRERVQNYALVLKQQLQDIENKIRERQPNAPLEKPTITSGEIAQREDPNLDIWRTQRMELISKLQAVAPIALINKLPQKNEDWMGSTFINALKKELLPDKFTKMNLTDMTDNDVSEFINANNLATNITETNLTPSAKSELEKIGAPIQAFSGNWWANLAGTSMSMIPSFALGGGVVTGISALSKAPSAINIARRMYKLSETAQKMKLARYVVPTLRSGAKGIEYMAAEPFLNQEDLKDEASFLSGFLGQAISGPIGRALSGENVGKLVSFLFKENAPIAAKLITTMGKRVADGVGEYGDEVGNTIGPLLEAYITTNDFDALKKDLNKNFGTLGVNMELFVGSVVMGMAMGGGNGIGGAAMANSKKIYSQMSKEDQKKADDIANALKDDVVKTEVEVKKQEIKDGEVPSEEGIVTPKDISEKEKAIEVIQSKESSTSEKIEAGKLLAEIERKEHEAKVTEQALNELEEAKETPETAIEEGIKDGEGKVEEVPSEVVEETPIEVVKEVKVEQTPKAEPIEVKQEESTPKVEGGVTAPDVSEVLKEVESTDKEQMSDNELQQVVGRDVFKQIQRSEEQLGEGVVDRNRMIETAKQIQKSDKKNKLLPEHIFEALQYETGFPDNWQDLRNAIKKGGIDINSESIQRQIEVGVKLPKDIVEEFKKSDRYKNANPELVAAVEELLGQKDSPSVQPPAGDKEQSIKETPLNEQSTPNKEQSKSIENKGKEVVKEQKSEINEQTQPLKVKKGDKVKTLSKDNRVISAEVVSQKGDKVTLKLSDGSTTVKSKTELFKTKKDAEVVAKANKEQDAIQNKEQQEKQSEKETIIKDRILGRLSAYNKLSSFQQNTQKNRDEIRDILDSATRNGFTIQDANAKNSNPTKKYELLKDGKKVGRSQSKNEAPKATPEQVKVAEKLLNDDMITLWDGNPLTPHLDAVSYGITWQQIRKGEQDIKEGKVDTEPARKLIEVLNQIESDQDVSMVVGAGAMMQNVGFDLDMARQAKKEIPELTDADINEINANIDSLAKEYDEWFETLSEQEQINILEENESRNQNEIEQSPESREGKSDVSNEKDGTREAVEEKVVENPLKDVESTAKALEGKDLSNIPRKAKGYEDTTDGTVGYGQREQRVKTKTFKVAIDGYGSVSSQHFIEKLVGANRLSNDFLSKKTNKFTDEFYNEQFNKNIDLFERQFEGTKEISEAYHKAKADGSNPELVKAVEDLLDTKSPREKSQEKAIDKLIDTLESLKVDNKNKLNAFGLLPETWNTALDIVITTIKAGERTAKAVGIAIQKAIDYVNSTNEKDNFDQNGFEDFVYGKLKVERPQVIEPPKTPKEVEVYQEVKAQEIISEVDTKKEPSKRKKALLNKAFNGVTDQQVKEAISKHDLEYYQESWITAKASAQAYIDEVGLDNALDSVRKGMVVGAPAAYIWSENIDEVGRQLALATDPTEVKQLQEIQASLLEEFGVQTKKGGQFISALRDIYANSEFGYDTTNQIKKYKDANNGVIPKEIEDRMIQMGKELEEIKTKLAKAEQDLKLEQEKQAIADIEESVEREAKRNQGKNIKQMTKEIADKIRKGKTSRPSIFMSSSPAAIVWDAALEVAAQTTGLIGNAISNAVEYLKNSDWYKGLSKDFQKEAERELVNHINQSANTEVGVTITNNKLKIPHELIRQYVANGVTEIEELVQAIKNELSETNPEITDRQIRDAITNYGKIINVNKEEIETQIRKMKRIGRIVSALEDIANKKRPLRSGQQRDKLDVEERSLNKQLKEALKELPMDAEAEANQLKTSLDAVKSRLRNQIEDLERQIETREKSAKARAIPYDEEAKQLIDERDRLKALRDEIFGGAEVSEEQRIERTIKATERAIKDLEQRIADNDLEAKKSKAVTSPELEMVRERLSVLRTQMKLLQEDAGIPQKRKLENAKRRTEKQIETLKQRIANKDFAKKKPKPLISDTELDKLRAEKIRIQNEFDKLQYQNELKNRTIAQKASNAMFEAWNLFRALRATSELSPVLLQGGVYTIGQSITNPMLAIRSFGEMFTQGFSEKKHEQWLQKLQAQEYYPRLKQSKLAITETDVKLNAKEELFLSGWVNHIWDGLGLPLKMIGPNAYEIWKKLSPPKFFERATVAYLNNIRLEKYLQGEEMLRLQGIEYNGNEKQYRAVADVVNTFTGRGSLGRLEMVSKPLAAVFFSPRMWSSTIQQTVALPYFYASARDKESTQKGLKRFKPTVAQKMILTDYMKYVALTASILMLVKASEDDDDKEGMKIEMDSRSSDFGKIKFGNTRIDPWGGRIQNIVLMSRMMSDSIVTGGEVRELGSTPFTPTKGGLLMRMVQNKLSPSSAMLAKYMFSTWKTDEVTGERYRVDQFGEPIGGPLSMATDNLYPIYYETISEIHKEQPAVAEGFLVAVAFFGMGVSVYGNDKILTKDEVYEYINKLNESRDEKGREKLRALINKQNKLKGITPKNKQIEFEKPKQPFRPITPGEYQIMTQQALQGVKASETTETTND